MARSLPERLPIFEFETGSADSSEKENANEAAQNVLGVRSHHCDRSHSRGKLGASRHCLRQRKSGPSIGASWYRPSRIWLATGKTWETRIMISRIGMTSGLATLFALATCLFAPYTASANLIFDSSLGGVTGSGLGAVSTILTIQSPGSGSFESGSVERAGGADVKSDTGVLASGGTTSVGDVKTGASQTLTRTLGENS